jgi:hypothetical protein
MRVELVWSVGHRRLEIRHVGAARVAVLLDAGELVMLVVLPAAVSHRGSRESPMNPDVRVARISKKPDESRSTTPPG